MNAINGSTTDGCAKVPKSIHMHLADGLIE
jgi:hypothetical protein